MIRLVVVSLAVLVLVSQSAVGPGNQYEQIRAFTRSIEFDYINWTIDALMVKEVQGTLNAPSYLDIPQQRKVVFEYFNLVHWVNQVSTEIDQIYANPSVRDPKAEAADRAQRLEILKGMEASLKPIAEGVLQQQVSTTVASLGLGFGGQPVPPILYHSTRLPDALIISPRDVIRQDYDISLEPELSIDQITQIEDSVEKKMKNVSALVVPIGGVGTYPTMVMNTTDLNWLLEVVSHEWTHNYLTLRPLGMLYMETPELRTINETTANLSGKEIGHAVMEHYYPDLLPPDQQPQVQDQAKSTPAPTPTPTPEDPNQFDFTREMHTTRVQVDQMLAEGKVKEAEKYMEQRRRFFWDHGYQIRKLNQAYFAFYGAYNDQPGGGAAGKDPVGPAVQELRKRSKSLADFLNRISWVTSFADLQKLLQ